MITFSPNTKESWVLTEEGKDILKYGSHEFRAFNAVPSKSEGISMLELQVRTETS